VEAVEPEITFLLLFSLLSSWKADMLLRDPAPTRANGGGVASSLFSLPFRNRPRSIERRPGFPPLSFSPLSPSLLYKRNNDRRSTCASPPLAPFLLSLFLLRQTIDPSGRNFPLLLFPPPSFFFRRQPDPSDTQGRSELRPRLVEDPGPLPFPPPPPFPPFPFFFFPSRPGSSEEYGHVERTTS